jgi:hypothetical protein
MPVRLEYENIVKKVNKIKRHHHDDNDYMGESDDKSFEFPSDNKCLQN